MADLGPKRAPSGTPIDRPLSQFLARKPTIFRDQVRYLRHRLENVGSRLLLLNQLSYRECSPTAPGPVIKGPESLVFRSYLKTGTASHEHFLFSEGRFSPDLRTWACQSLGHNPLISHRSIRAGFISGSEYWHALQTTGSESLRACQTRFLSLFYLSVLLTLLT